MKRLVFESLEKISGFDVDVRSVHSKSSNISLVNLSEGESFEIEEANFSTHITVLSGKVEMISNNIQDVFEKGCLVSILPDQRVYINARSKSRLLVIRDDPLWVLRERRNVRSFSNVPVSKDLVVKILEFARFAPSSGNAQPWKVYITEDPEKKKLLSRYSHGQGNVSQAPWVIVITTVPGRSVEKRGKRGKRPYAIQDTAAFATYIMLAAKAYNLDTCWVGEFDEEKVREVIGAPSEERPVVIIPIGYSEEVPATSDRKPLSDILKEF